MTSEVFRWIKALEEHRKGKYGFSEGPQCKFRGTYEGASSWPKSWCQECTVKLRHESQETWKNKQDLDLYQEAWIWPSFIPGMKPLDYAVRSTPELSTETLILTLITSSKFGSTNGSKCSKLYYNALWLFQKPCLVCNSLITVDSLSRISIKLSSNWIITNISVHWPFNVILFCWISLFTQYSYSSGACWPILSKGGPCDEILKCWEQVP